MVIYEYLYPFISLPYADTYVPGEYITHCSFRATPQLS